MDSGRTVNYTFDALHRLSTAVTTGSTNYPKWGLSWTYDRYGNRTAQTVTAGSAFSGSPTVDPNTNRITALGTASFSYDLSGNLTQDDLYKYVYDAESHLVQLQQLSGSPITTYSLDGNGLRVIKVQVGSAIRTYSLYDGTDVISEFSDNSTTTYTSGTTPQQAPADSISLLLYHFGDHLTTRMTADNFASNASYEGHYPFGETWYDTGMAYPSVTKKFTSYNKDTEASTAFLNYAIYRQHSARLGRFHMVDPIHGKTNNPQSLNRFSYGLSDPINNVDPTGLFGVKVYIPPDWPCNAWSVTCGCDPFEGGFGPGAGFEGGAPGPGDGDSSETSGCTLGGGSGGGSVGETSCKLTMSVSAPGPFCDNTRTNTAYARLAGTTDLVNPSSIDVRAKGNGNGSVSITRDGYHGLSFFNWMADYRAWESPRGSTIIFTAKYKCFDGTKDTVIATVSGVCGR